MTPKAFFLPDCAGLAPGIAEPQLGTASAASRFDPRDALSAWRVRALRAAELGLGDPGWDPRDALSARRVRALRAAELGLGDPRSDPAGAVYS